MKIQSLSGSCASRFFWDLGGAHNVPNPKDLDSFANDFITRGYARSNICVTCEYQVVVRGYLKELGWEETKCGDLIVHVISYSKLHAKLEKWRVERQKKLQEEKEKRALEQKKRQEELIKLRTNRKDQKFEYVSTKHLREVLRGSRLAYANIWGERLSDEQVRYLREYFGLPSIPLPGNIWNSNVANYAKMIRYRLDKEDKKVVGKNNLIAAA